MYIPRKRKGQQMWVGITYVAAYNLPAMSQVWWMLDIPQDSIQTRPRLLQYLQLVGRREINNKVSKE